MAGSTTNIGLIKPTYSEDADVAIINENMDTLDSTISALDNGLAIVSNNNTHGAITAGQYVYVRNHGSLAEGMYTANSNIAANATLSSSNLTAVSSGSLNKLNSGLNALNSKLSRLSNPTYCSSKTQVDAALWETVNLGTTNFRILVINNSSKNDAFTSMANTATGVLLVFEAYSIWNDHPLFIYLAGNNEMYIGTATVTQNGTTIQASNKMTHN